MSERQSELESLLISLANAHGRLRYLNDHDDIMRWDARGRRALAAALSGAERYLQRHRPDKKLDLDLMHEEWSISLSLYPKTRSPGEQGRIDDCVFMDEIHERLHGLLFSMAGNAVRKRVAALEAEHRERRKGPVVEGNLLVRASKHATLHDDALALLGSLRNHRGDVTPFETVDFIGLLGETGPESGEHKDKRYQATRYLKDALAAVDVTFDEHYETIQNNGFLCKRSLPVRWRSPRKH